MTALASTDVTVTVSTRNRDIWAGTNKRCQIATVAFGNATLTYPANGVPLPAKGVFGFVKAIEFGVVMQPLDGLLYKYDLTNHKILIYGQGITTGATTAADAVSGALALDYAGAENAVRLMGTAISTIYYFGGLKEMPAAFAPAATSFLMMLIGE